MVSDDEENEGNPTPYGENPNVPTANLLGSGGANLPPPTMGFQAFPGPPQQLFQPSQPTQPSPNILPSVPQSPEGNPGGFQSFHPTVTPSVNPITSSNNSISLTAEQLTKAQKYCKWAGSALNYDDVKTAITNLSNALQLLQTGHDPAP